jgi:uncharacterized protein YciI
MSDWSPASVLALLVVALGAAAARADPVPPPGSAAAAANTYLVVYRRGPAWQEGRPMREQVSLREHFHYYLGLHGQGRLLAGGGFTDESGGAAIFSADSDAAADAVVAADPAVKSGVFRAELQRLKLNDWDAIARRQAAQ